MSELSGASKQNGGRWAMGVPRPAGLRPVEHPRGGRHLLRVVGALAASLLAVGGVTLPSAAEDSVAAGPVRPATLVLRAVDGHVVWTADPTGPVDTDHDVPLDESEVATGPIELALDTESELGWDLTGLGHEVAADAAVVVELVGARGPGRFIAGVTTEPDASTGSAGDAGVIDPAAGPVRTDLPIGRRGTFRWTFTEAGSYELDLAAELIVGDQVSARATRTYRVMASGPASEPPAPPSTEPAPHQPASIPGAASPDLEAAPAATEPSPERTPAPVAAPARTGVPRQAPAGERVVIDDGHVDMGPRVVDGRWRVQLKDDSVTPHVWHDLADVVLHLKDNAITRVPDRPAYAFLGAPGTEVYMAPQAQQAGIVWPGWNTQDPTVVSPVPGSVTWRLRGVDGPGRFVLFVTDSFGDTEVFFDTDDAFPQELVIPRNSHVHANWGFTEAGVYRLSVEMAATAGDGTALADTRTLTIVVGDGFDPDEAFTPDPGGEGTPVAPPAGGGTSPPAGGGDDPSGPGGAGPGGVGSGGTGPGGTGRNGAGGLASTGANGLGHQAVTGLLLLGLGSALVLVRHGTGGRRARAPAGPGHRPRPSVRPFLRP